MGSVLVAALLLCMRDCGLSCGAALVYMFV